MQSCTKLYNIHSKHSVYSVQHCTTCRFVTPCPPGGLVNGRWAQLHLGPCHVLRVAINSTWVVWDKHNRARRLARVRPWEPLACNPFGARSRSKSLDLAPHRSIARRNKKKWLDFFSRRDALVPGVREGQMYTRTNFNPTLHKSHDDRVTKSANRRSTSKQTTCVATLQVFAELGHGDGVMSPWVAE